jgi:hypothetical protein
MSITVFYGVGDLFIHILYLVAGRVQDLEPVNPLVCHTAGAILFKLSVYKQRTGLCRWFRFAQLAKGKKSRP